MTFVAGSDRHVDEALFRANVAQRFGDRWPVIKGESAESSVVTTDVDRMSRAGTSTLIRTAGVLLGGSGKNKTTPGVSRFALSRGEPGKPLIDGLPQFPSTVNQFFIELTIDGSLTEYRLDIGRKRFPRSTIGNGRNLVSYAAQIDRDALGDGYQGLVALPRDELDFDGEMEVFLPDGYESTGNKVVDSIAALDLLCKTACAEVANGRFQPVRI